MCILRNSVLIYRTVKNSINLRAMSMELHFMGLLMTRGYYNIKTGKNKISI